MFKIGFSLSAGFDTVVSNAQNTVGSISLTNDAFEGFTLFSVYKKTYLINNCGQVINEWTSEFLPGNSVYLLPNGNLLRASSEKGLSSIFFGGVGGKVELFNWEGDLIWHYDYNTDNYRQHHDIYPMPNGNILILAATLVSESAAISLGRDPSKLTEGELYNERIIEIEPFGTSEANLVWEWNVIDHVVQDFDNTKFNFADVSRSEGKLDINFLNGGNGGANWLHCNSIQYNDKLDQIVISSRNLSEIWVIDHSTTSLEAASSSGGLYGKGGDFLYRWGNAQSYKQGTEEDRKLYGQHSSHFIKEGLDDEGKIMLFNNGNGRTPAFSEVYILNPPATNGNYSYTENTAFGPENPDYVFSDLSENPSPFYSNIVSGAQKLPNGNILICQGKQGYFFEIDENGNKVWEYVNPVSSNNGSIASQLDSQPNNLTFRATKYTIDYAAFIGKDLTPSLPIENNSNTNACDALSLESVNLDLTKVYPNPVNHFLQLNLPNNSDFKIEIFDLLGKNILTTNNKNKSL